MRIIVVTRKECYSPRSVQRDAAIAQAVASALVRFGVKVEMVEERRVEKWYADDIGDIDMWLSMGRMPETTAFLKMREDCGDLVVNSGYGVEACTRHNLNKVMRDNHLPLPPDKGDDGFWVKRGDAAAQDVDDVVWCADEQAVETVRASLASRGVTSIVVSAHLVGDLVKFYGVEGTGFFHTCYPTEGGFSKFGNESRNGAPHHYPFDSRGLQEDVERLSRLVRTPVYGGDCIVTPEGRYAIIDFNDWPSFEPCRDDAANAIASLAIASAKRDKKMI